MTDIPRMSLFFATLLSFSFLIRTFKIYGSTFHAREAEQTIAKIRYLGIF
jgi:hypothetical protein